MSSLYHRQTWNGSETGSLSYKDITEFKSYAATIDFVSTGYVFEFRDAGTGDLLSVYNTADVYPLLPIFKNLTLILYGDPGSQQIMSANNY